MIFFFSCLFFGSKKILIILYWLLSPFQDQSLVPKYWGNMTGQTQLEKVFCAQRSGFIIEKEAMRTVNYPSCICSQSALQHYIVSLHIHNSGSPKLLILLRHIQVLDLPPIISSTYISIGLVAHLQHLAKLNKKSLQFHTHPPPLFLNHFWANTPLLRKPSEF